ncbi:trehalose-phosphatase [Rhizobium ruizarguesonis]|uniref:trehalose-phosphatase n=1 Tax=Rhizobium ruizarguesonis TaxID=2081791 RepID=UPI0018D58E7E|nr:trehalose-phosphatase [Rhizobium ruizarguesonis]
MQSLENAVQDDTATQEMLSMVLEEPDRWAMFLDIDGTLLNLAPTPDAIEVPEALPGQLHRLSNKLGGALALVTGRSLAYADALFKPFAFPTAGLHGAEIRNAAGMQTIEATPEFQALKHALTAEAEHYPGVLIEDKGAAVAAHYRLAPEYEKVLEDRMHHYAELAGPNWALQLGKMVFELRPARSSKGDALERFFQSDPFKNRSPITIGDDLTDESMFAIANARGGVSVRVGAIGAPSCATSRLSSAALVRNVIAALAA